MSGFGSGLGDQLSAINYLQESVLSIFTHFSLSCSRTPFDGITHEQTIICRQLFAGHVIRSPPMKRKKKCAER